MAKHYAICENMCMEEVYSKEQIDEQNQRLYFKTRFTGKYINGGGVAVINRVKNSQYLSVLKDYYVESMWAEDVINDRYLLQTTNNYATLKSQEGYNVEILPEVKFIKVSDGYGMMVTFIGTYTWDPDNPGAGGTDEDTVDFYIHVMLRKKTEEPIIDEY